jgi:hypothetical protein
VPPGYVGPIDSDRTQREREFSRRALLRAGWALPVAVSLGGLASACGGGGDDARRNGVHGDHADSAHTDSSHTDAGSGEHADQPHGDDVHTDTGRYRHVDTPHADHTDVAGHADAAAPSHSDTQEPGGRHGDHADAGAVVHDDAHNDAGCVHADTPHTDTHGDVPYSDGASGTITVHNDVPGPVHGDSIVQQPQHDDVSHQDTHSDAAHADRC